jgi:23S rRNA (uracil1939-C5)-methyltransferase
MTNTNVLQRPDQTVEPVCCHFGACGGCSLQDWPTPDQLAWKRDQLITALVKAGYENPPVSDIIAVPMGVRRRADFALARQEGRAVLGLHEARSKAVIDLAECPLVLPEIAALMPPLRALAATLQGFRKEGSVIVIALDDGLDVTIRLDGEATAEDRARLVAFARAQNLLRISLGDEPVAVLRDPVISFGGIKVTAPPAAFLQPSLAGEMAIRDAVLAALPEKINRKARVIELYAGIGTLSFCLVQHGRVHAVEGNAASATALAAAANANNLAGRITVETRDLARRPLLPADFKGAAALVLDPPFDGAGPQMRGITLAKPPCVIYVSCNPQALVRDARSLRDAGYRLISATPIDQFPASSHLEAVVVFTV